MGLFDRFRPNVEGLRQSGDYPGLIGLLAGDDPGSRADAAQALNALGVSAIPDIFEALKSAGPGPRARMTEALASVGIPSIPLFLALILRADPALQSSLSRAIAGAGDEVFDALLPALHHEQPAIRRAAVIALRETGRKAVPHLVRVFRDGNQPVRREAANALAGLRWAPEDLQEKILFYFLLEDWGELAKLQGAAVPTLQKALGNSDRRIRCESARTLGKIRDGRAIPALVRLVKDPDAEVRVCAAEALGQMGDDRAKPALVEGLNDPDHRVRMEAAWALDRLGWVPQSDLQRAEHLIAGEQWNKLIRLGRPAIPPLIRALEVEYSGVRTGANEALRQLGQPALDALSVEATCKNAARQQRARAALEYIRRRQEEASLKQPAPADTSRYETELKEGLDTQKRFEKQFGRPTYLTKERVGKPSPQKGGEPVPENAEEPPVQQAASKPGKPGNLQDLIKESRQAEAAWAQVKARLKTEVSSTAVEPVALDQLIPLEFEEAIAGNDESAAVEAPVRREPGGGLEVEDLEIPELPRTTPEPVVEPPKKTSLEQYLEALRSSDETVRAAAVVALQGMGKEAIGYLIGALRDPHHAVRIAAAEALGEIGDPDAVEPLVLLFRDAREDVRIAAAAALGRIGDRRSIPALIRLFGDSYHGVRVAAADAVVIFGRDALGLLEEAQNDPVPVVRVTAARAIGLIGATESIPALIEHLGDPAPEVRWSVARALAEFGPQAVDPLFLVLRKGTKEMRLAAIDALWEMPGDRAGKALRYALDDSDEDVRAKAAAALRKREVVDVWRRALGSQVQDGELAGRKKKSVQQEDKKAFEQSGRQEIDALVAALKDKDWNTQLGAATRLIMMGRPAVDGLIRALRDEDPEIQTAAASLLGEMRETAVEPLMTALNDTDRFVRFVAARNLGKIGNRRAIEALIGSLHREPDREVRAAVAEALGYMGSRQAIEPLVLALQDRSEEVQIAAARSLGYIRDSRAIEPLLQALTDVDDRVRHAALEALKDPGGTARDYLVDALRSREEKVRKGVAETLEAGGWEPETREEEALYLMARDRWAGVEQLGADALPLLVEALSDRSIEMRTNVVRTIARIGGEDAVAPLIRMLRDNALAVRMRAERGLIEIGNPALPALAQALDGAEQEGRPGLQRVIDAIRARNSS
ncbi:HEAT repeat domain-containing protein [Methanoculleus sp. Wushi-C6]|uniref:HEAT repeat domain-containing protein n=1 Tax=Methanoculleus caldifontis TaxID=2651577 RepID=A0ABU3X3S1_9EURY|nr:HEAT repeat domain-containing protein [Methanoculleus sp. Wushi-C6]MDV2482252.1 HEAT repeat domain-containing protein [Methanoculleus sp. Wushi-C6]